MTWPGELDLPHRAPAVDGVGHRVEQAVGQAGVFNHLGLALAQPAVALNCSKPAPNHGGEQIARDLLACQVLQVCWPAAGFWCFPA